VLIIGSPTVKEEAEVKSELRVGTDFETISSLPGGAGLKGKLEVRLPQRWRHDAEDSNLLDLIRSTLDPRPRALHHKS